MSQTAKRSRRTAKHGRIDRRRSTGAGLAVVALTVVAALAVIAFFTMRPNAQAGTGASSGGEQTTAAASQEKTDAANTAKDKDAKDEKENTDANKDEKESTDANKDAADAEGDANSGEDDAETNAGDASADDTTQTATIGNSYNEADETDGQASSQEGDDQNASDSASDATPQQDAEPADTNSSSSSSSTSDWMEAVAVASCVSESGRITASEIPFDDDVPQVGINVSQNPWAHFGDYVEVRYGDATVKAQVIDCGRYGGRGKNGILINPAVFREFGISSVYDWGRRTVSYRYV